tara:strand:+ start:5218 stop:6189 length:972 start_codon:yes stop_codon:yes gene_type:complete
MDASDLTLIFFIRDRQFNIDKLVYHYEPLKCRKVIYDSSPNPVDKDVISSLKSDNIEYVWLDGIPFLVAKNLAFSDAKTEYIMDCPDDDLFILSSIQKGLTILRENTGYVSCQGHENWYDSQTKKLFGCDTIDRYDYLLTNDSLVENPIQRIQKEISFFVGYAHALHRTKFHLANNRFLLENIQYKSGVWEETIPGILSAIHGNRKIIPDLWTIRHRIWSRSDETHGVDRISCSTGRETFWYGITKAVTDEENLKPVSQYLSNSANISYEEAFKVIKSSLDEHDSKVSTKRKSLINTEGNVKLSELVRLMDTTSRHYEELLRR